nr:PREDICTED: fucolectin-like [Latimeria chalumnae]|eukprot:XP_014354455.1 PREDICTED: fucolectin-like [Latimeria chalumnae]
MTEKNIAEYGKAFQSSTLDEKGEAGNAVDGNMDSNYASSSCSSTKNDLGPWWMLKFGRPYKISSITITNRGDCCPERLQGAIVHIGNMIANSGVSNPVCGMVTSVSVGSKLTFCCKGMEGHYISINIPGRNEYLTLCEVEVMGIMSEDKCQQFPDGRQPTLTTEFSSSVNQIVAFLYF